MMMVEVKKEFIKEYMKKNNLTKTQFCKFVHTSHKMFNKIMNGEKVGLFVALRYASSMQVEDEKVFDWNFTF